MTKNALDIVVPIYKNAALVRQCVDSVLDHVDEIADRRPRLILINDSPGDQPVEELLWDYAARTEIEIIVLRNEQNLGFVRTVNRGLKIAQAAHRDVLLVNSDTITFEGTLRNLLEATAADPQISFASPRSNNASICSLPHFHAGLPASPTQAHARWMSLSASMPAWHFSPTAVGFYMWISRCALADHGGLREDFGPGYEEENDLVMRGSKVGRRAIMVNNAFAFHAGSASFSLTNLDLAQHRFSNYQRMSALHPEFEPLVRRYQASAHYRAERLMQGLLKDDQGRLRLVFDLSGLGLHHNGTNEHAIAVVRSLLRRWRDRFRIAAVGDAKAFAFHGLDDLEGLVRVEPGAPGVHGVAVRVAQPFDLHHVNVMEGLAPVNIYAMLDTIAEDCSQLSAQETFLDLWDYVGSHASGLLFNSRFGERTYLNRYPQAAQLPRFAHLLSTRVSEYRRRLTGGERNHVLVLGNHFPHKHSEPAARRLAGAHPTLQFITLGSRTYEEGNIIGIRSGQLEARSIESLYADASVIVLPSFMEGFGLGLLHALAAGKPIVARRIPPTEEILATLSNVEGIFLYDDETAFEGAFAAALAADRSHADPEVGVSWDDWADGVAELALALADRKDVFPTLVRRIRAGDMLRRAALANRAAAAPAAPADPAAPAPTPAAPRTQSVADLLLLNGAAFVEGAYRAILLRPPEQAGLSHHLYLMENGASKTDVLVALAKSEEGTMCNSHVEGLDELVVQQAREAVAR